MDSSAISAAAVPVSQCPATQAAATDAEAVNAEPPASPGREPHAGDRRLLGDRESPRVELRRRWSCETCRKRKRKCDGVRPYCGRCVKDGLAYSCVFVGTIEKVDPSLAWQHRLMIHATVSSSLGGHVEAVANPILKSFLKPPTHRSSGGAASQHRSSDSGASQLAQPDAGDDRLGELFQKAMAMHSRFFFSPAPSLESALTTVPIRPGADATEQDIFLDLFFRRRVTVVQVVHKLSYLRDKHKAPAFLQAAICAMGASDEAVKNLPQDVMMYYYEFARSQAMQWLDAPSLESLQALLILADVSLHIGKNVVARMLSGFACRLIPMTYPSIFVLWRKK
ncbi:hypothetical protein DFJ73DRAFT_324955 [Zopfochytrium polystomum]|nr:hypothetical protein DFJ73DRAFT_324955 [Zopfochytrium polystomum]